MYDELVKRLRASVDGRYEKCDGCPYEEDYPCCVDCLDKMHKQAAEAIEERCQQVDKFAAEAARLYATFPRWIPVTERLPCLTTPVLATDGIEVDIAWMYGVPPRWITSFTAIDEDKLTHWMPLPQTPKGK